MRHIIFMLSVLKLSKRIIAFVIIKLTIIINIHIIVLYNMYMTDFQAFFF